MTKECRTKRELGKRHFWIYDNIDNVFVNKWFGIVSKKKVIRAVRNMKKGGI